MAQQIISNDESGLNARNAINQNFTELYNNLLIPIKIPGISSNTTQPIAANVWIAAITVGPVSGGPVTLRIGTSPNGEELLADYDISQVTAVNTNLYSGTGVTLYFTFSGTAGVINVRIDVINNYF